MHNPHQSYPVEGMPRAEYWCDGVWRAQRLGFGLYEVQCGSDLHRAGSPLERVTTTWVGVFDDFGGFVPLSDASLAALDVAFNA